MGNVTSTLPDSATVGDSGHTTDHNLIRTAAIELAGCSLDNDTWLNVNEYAGADDDAKLDAAITDAAAIRSATDTTPILYLCGGKTWLFSDARTINYNFFKLSGPPGATADETRGSVAGGAYVKIATGSNAWLTFSTNATYGHYIGNINFEASGGSSVQFAANSSGAVVWTTLIENVSFTEFKHVFGKPGTKFYCNAVLWQGWWYVNNARGPSFVLGGSDNIFWDQGMLIDTPGSPDYPTTYWTSPSSNNGDGFHITFDYMEKSTVGALYMTIRNQIGGVLVLGGSSTDGQLVFTGGRYEGQNSTTGANGCVIRQMGGGTIWRDCWIAYGMKAPSSGPRGSTYNKGIMEVYGGKMLVDGCTYSRHTSPSVAESVPFVYNGGAEVYVHNIIRANSDGASSWSGRPVVMEESGSTVVDHFETSLSLPSGYVQTATMVDETDTAI